MEINNFIRMFNNLFKMRGLGMIKSGLFLLAAAILFVALYIIVQIAKWVIAFLFFIKILKE